MNGHHNKINGTNNMINGINNMNGINDNNKNHG